MEHLIECTCGFKQEGEDPKELGMNIQELKYMQNLRDQYLMYKK